MDAATGLEALDRATLTGPIRRALRSETVEIGDWHCHSIHGSRAPSSGGLYRVGGTACDRGDTVSWSLVLKVVHAGTGCEGPSDVYYWQREVLAYHSGLLDDLPGDLAAPRCLGVVEQRGESAWLFLEEVTDTCGPRWPLSCYGRAARHLGRFNGAYLAGRPVPAHSCLSKGWLRLWVVRNAPAIARLHGYREHPLVRRAYPAPIAAGLLRLWAEREMFLAALASLPQTFCHMDAWRRNLLVRSVEGRDQLVAIDWAFTGCGALGEELAPLVGASLYFERELSAAQELDETAFAGYIDGLREAGWRGDPRVVRLGYTAALGLRYGPGITIEVLRRVLDARHHVGTEQADGESIEERCDRIAGWFSVILDRADEARELIGVPG
jgi:hypothetical protein